MHRICTYLGAGLLALMAGQAQATVLAHCERITHVAHGGQSGHSDLGEGRVIWLDWWNQEGIAEDLVLVECASGDALRFRTVEENMNRRLPLRKTDEAMRIVATEHKAARVFATLPRIAAAVEGVARDVTLFSLASHETCACSALYPELRGDKLPFSSLIVDVQ